MWVERSRNAYEGENGMTRGGTWNLGDSTCSAQSDSGDRLARTDVEPFF